MSSCHIKKVSLLDASKNYSSPATTLNTTDISLNNASLESYKKALHNIVRRLNKTPSSNSKSLIRRSESKLNQTQQPLYNSNAASSSNLQNQKKHYVSNSYSGKNQSTPKRSHSIEANHYKTNKDMLNKSMNEAYMRKDSLPNNITKSVSINKLDKQSTPELNDITEEKLARAETSYTQEATVNATILHEVNLNSLDQESEKKLRDLVHKYQLRDVVNRQEILKLKKSNDSLKSQVDRLDKELEKSNKNRELDKKYIYKLETELGHMKEKSRLGSADKRPSTANNYDNKENKYLKMIEDLKAQVSTLTTEKKVVEHLLKNSLLQNEMSKDKENTRIDKRLNSSSMSISNNQAKVLNTMESTSYGVNSSKNLNIGARVKTDSFVKKAAENENLNDENDFSTHARQPPQSQSFVGVPNLPMRNEKVTDGYLKEVRDNHTNMTMGKMTNLFTTTTDANPTLETVECHDEGDEGYPLKVVQPRLGAKSLKERIDMSQFKLDLTRISKGRKAD